ncbi:MAG: PEP-CTERM sorting domain-containing protein [Planctomycetota bacterium]
MKNKHGVLVFVMALAVSVLTITESARAITIDSFDTTSQSISANSSSTFPVSNTVAASEAIGGFRTLEILGVAGPSNAILEVITGGPGLLALSNAFGTSSTARVTWDANGVGLGGLDLTGSGAFDSIGLDLISIDQGNVSLTVSIFETAVAGGSFASLLLPSAVIGQNVFEFDTFTNFFDVSFNLVNKITLDIVAGTASDLAVDFFETLENPVIPEPATVGLLGIGLAGLGSVYLRRKYRRSKKQQCK